MFRLTAVVGDTQKQWAYLTESEATQALTKVQKHFSAKPTVGNVVRLNNSLSLSYYCQDGSLERLHFTVSQA